MGKNADCGLALHKGLSLVHAVSSAPTQSAALCSRISIFIRSVACDKSESVRKLADGCYRRTRAYQNLLWNFVFGVPCVWKTDSPKMLQSNFKNALGLDYRNSDQFAISRYQCYLPSPDRLFSPIRKNCCRRPSRRPKGNEKVGQDRQGVLSAS